MEVTNKFDSPGKKLRTRLVETCPTGADFVAFCVDYFPQVARRFSPGMQRTDQENLLFQIVELLEIEQALETFGPSPPPTPDPLFDRIVTACRHKERPRRSLKIDLLQGDAQLRLIRVSFEEGGHNVCYGLSFTRGPVSVSLLAQLRELLHCHALDGQLCTWPRLVYEAATEAQALTDVVRKAAATGPLPILIDSVEEYEALIDFRETLNNQSSRLADDQRYPPMLYVPQRLEVANGPGLSFSKHSGVALDSVLDWLQRPGGRFVLVLGEFGTGKTFLLYEIARQLGRRGSPVVPLLIELRRLEKKHDLNSLLSDYMQRERCYPIDPERLRHMCRLGKIVLLFDGFDELALRTDYREAAQYLETLLSAVDGESKVLITSRTQHFLTDQQIATALGQRLAQVPTLAARLLGFSRDQIQRFLANQFGEAEVAARFELIDQVKDLLGLSENPRMLSLIAQIEPERLRRLGQVGAAQLYEAIVEQWIEREIERKTAGSYDAMMNREQLMQALEWLARRLWESPTSPAKLEGLEQATQQVLRGVDLQLGVAAHQLGSSSLLCRDEDGCFTFFHFSLLEWFIARDLVKEIEGQRYALWHSRLISPLMAEFLCGFLGDTAARDWVAQILDQFAESDATDPGTMVKSTQLLAKQLKMPYAQLLQLTEQDLTASKLAQLNLSRAVLRGFDLRGMTLVGKDLRGADLSLAKLADANLSQANLRKAILHKADFSRANLIGADLRNAKLTEANFYRAQLLDAWVDVEELKKADTFGAALSEPLRITQLPARLEGPHTTALAWHPQGDLIAAPTDGNGIAVYDSLTGECIRILLGHTDAVLSAAFSPDGKTLATGSCDFTIKLWSIGTATCVKTLRAHRHWVRSVTFSPNGQTLASASDDGSIGLWNTRDLRLRHHPLRHQGGVRSVTFAPDSQTLVSACDDGTVRRWNVEDARVVQEFATHQGQVLSVAFSPKGGVVVLGAQDGGVGLWEAETSHWMRILGQHDSWVFTVAFAPDGRSLATGGLDGKIRLWSVPEGQLLHVLSPDSGRVQGVVFAPDGRTLASISREGTVVLWSTARGERLRILEHELAPRLGPQWLTSGLCRFPLENATVHDIFVEEKTKAAAQRFLVGLALISVFVMLVLLAAPELWHFGLSILMLLIGYTVTRKQIIAYFIGLPNKQKIRQQKT